MTMPKDSDVVSMTLALEEVGTDENMGPRGLRFMCREAARLIRRLRPDLAFVEDDGRK